MTVMCEYLHGNQRLPRTGFELMALRPLLRKVLGFLLFMTAFYFAYRYGMSFSQACAAPFWFPDSVLLCALLLRPAETMVALCPRAASDSTVRRIRFEYPGLVPGRCIRD